MGLAAQAFVLIVCARRRQAQERASPLLKWTPIRAPGSPANTDHWSGRSIIGRAPRAARPVFTFRRPVRNSNFPLAASRPLCGPHSLVCAPFASGAVAQRTIMQKKEGEKAKWEQELVEERTRAAEPICNALSLYRWRARFRCKTSAPTGSPGHSAASQALLRGPRESCSPLRAPTPAG